MSRIIGIIALLIITTSTHAQVAEPAKVYSDYSRLGINGPVKTVTIYKYNKLNYTPNEEDSTTGKLYSVIKHWYDTSGYLIKDSSLTFYNSKQAMGACRTYSYTTSGDTVAMYMTARYNCVPPYDNNDVDNFITYFQQQNDSLIIAKQYNSHNGKRYKKQPSIVINFFVVEGLIVRSSYKTYVKGEAVTQSTQEHSYDKYGNFTNSIEKRYSLPAKKIKHKVSHIDEMGNATRMLNFVDDSPIPEFLTTYEIEYYD